MLPRHFLVHASPKWKSSTTENFLESHYVHTSSIKKHYWIRLYTILDRNVIIVLIYIYGTSDMIFLAITYFLINTKIPACLLAHDAWCIVFFSGYLQQFLVWLTLCLCILLCPLRSCLPPPPDFLLVVREWRCVQQKPHRVYLPFAHRMKYSRWYVFR